MHSKALFFAQEALALREWEVALKPGQVLVKMLAAAVHPADRLAAAGHYPRKSEIAGNEGVGEVVDNGEEDKLRPGDRVIVTTSDVGGVWSEYQVFSAEHLLRVPKELSLQAAATLRINPGTAYRLLADYACKENGKSGKDSILVSAVNSQVGRSLLQLVEASEFGSGLRVIGLVRSECRKREMETEFPKHRFFLQSDEQNWISAVKESNCKVALDCVGGELSGRMLSSLPADNSVLCSYGAISGRPLSIPVGPLVFQGKSVVGFWVSEWFRTAGNDKASGMLNRIVQLFMEDKLQPPGLRTVKMEELAGEGAKLESDMLIDFTLS